MTIDAILEAVARDAEDGPQKHTSLYNLQELDQYNRLMIAGRLADLTVEHQYCVRQEDIVDPDVLAITHAYPLTWGAREIAADWESYL